jgi:transposase-like protein
MMSSHEQDDNHDDNHDERIARMGVSAEMIHCPFCAADDLEPMSLFGSQLLTAQYYCRACHTPFEHMKGEATGADTSAPSKARDQERGQPRGERP